MLSYIDKDLTTEAIIDELYAHRKDTVSELVSVFEDKSKEVTGKTLQQNLDSLLKNEVIVELLNSIDMELANKISYFYHV